jgi:hypothetical protein
MVGLEVDVDARVEGRVWRHSLERLSSELRISREGRERRFNPVKPTERPGIDGQVKSRHDLTKLRRVGETGREQRAGLEEFEAGPAY